MKPNIQNKGKTSRKQTTETIDITTTNVLNNLINYINTDQTEVLFLKAVTNQTNKYLEKNDILTFLYDLIIQFLRNIQTKLVMIPSKNELLPFIHTIQKQLMNYQNLYTLPFIKQYLPIILITVNQNKINKNDDKDTDTKYVHVKQTKMNQDLEQTISDTNSVSFGTNKSKIETTVNSSSVNVSLQITYIDDNDLLLIPMLPKKLLDNDIILLQFIKKAFGKYMPTEYKVMRGDLIVVCRINNISSTGLQKLICITLRDLGFGFILTQLVKYSSKYLIPAISNADKIYSLILDIDHTLINVRRWIDEIQINDKLLYKNKLCAVIKIKKQIIFDKKNGSERNVGIYCFDNETSLGKFSSVLYEGDEYNDSVIRVIKTKQIMVCDENGKVIKIPINDVSLKNDLRYYDNIKDEKYIQPDLIYDNLYLVRFRDGLHKFFNKIVQYDNLEIILWTASVGDMYTNLMRQVQLKLLYEIGMSLNAELWDILLCREQCTEYRHGYFKDLLRLGRDCDRLIIVDNSTFSFRNFETNLLPINNYYGHKNDKQLYKLVNVFDEMFMSDDDINIQSELHSLAFKYDFSSFKLKQMRKRMGFKHNQTLS